MIPPKLFISYSWSDPTHEQWVLDLATELRESGVDVILDKWDLRPGQDAIAFMEQMVTNAEIKKVALICNQKYASKADERAGGVGTETQIISRDVYENKGQEKFVAIVTSKDEHGRPHLPAYYSSRLYIDLSEPDRYTDNFERLLRWVFDRPVDVKPEIGQPPSFIHNLGQVELGTTTYSKRAVDFLRSGKPSAIGALSEYFEKFGSNLERFRLTGSAEFFDDQVVKSIEEFLPYRNEFVNVVATAATHSTDDSAITIIHQFFESALPLLNRPIELQAWREWDFDNFRFILHELFLYTLATLIKQQRLDWAGRLLAEHYFQPNDGGDPHLTSHAAFWAPMKSLDARKQRLKAPRSSLRADMLKERCKGTSVGFHDLMQADFIAFIRAELRKNGYGRRWIPDTLIFLGHFHSPFEIFVRASSRLYFERLRALLGIQEPNELEPLLLSYQSGSRKLPHWDYWEFSPRLLLGYEQLATLP